MLFHNLERRWWNTFKHTCIYAVDLLISRFYWPGFVYGIELDSRDGKCGNVNLLVLYFLFGHKYQGCCISVVNLTEIYPKLTICININRTTKPVENFCGAFGSLHYGTFHPEKAVHEVVCQQLCPIRVIFLPWKIKSINMVSYSLYLFE